mgnify:CR=1 FL=1
MKTYFGLVVMLFGFGVSHSQINVLNADQPNEIGVLSEEQQEALSGKKYLEYSHVDEKDIMWSKIVYEEIDLSEKFNRVMGFRFVDFGFNLTPNDGMFFTINSDFVVLRGHERLNGLVIRLYDFTILNNFYFHWQSSSGPKPRSG